MQMGRCGLGFFLVLAGASGCTPSPPVPGPAETPAPAATTSTVIENAEPGVVELTSATAKYAADNIVRFEIAYKFTSGSPVKFYQCDIQFPGTTNRGFKPMEAWEVKPEGVIKTGIEVADDAVKDFSITFAEADSPDRGYKVISNTLTGEIESAKPAE
ncbi:MAG TPA: hypothetical protein VM165_16185 [Planctomycetaceae bacterium]|nr:hypothetical protein [Planctomycetaceae bacterium]